MKTRKELNTLKEEVENVSRKLHSLSEEELAQVTGGSALQPRTVEVDTDSPESFQHKLQKKIEIVNSRSVSPSPQSYRQRKGIDRLHGRCLLQCASQQ